MSNGRYRIDRGEGFLGVAKAYLGGAEARLVAFL
jgi:hypothetical protein